MEGVVRIRGKLKTGFDSSLQIEKPQAYLDGNWVLFPGKMFFSKARLEKQSIKSDFEIVGRIHCDHPLKNFSDFEDRFFLKKNRVAWIDLGFNEVDLSDSISLSGFSLGERARGWLRKKFLSYSSLFGMVWAVWTGETTGLEPLLVQMYRDGGLLPLVALSGQHVAIFILLLRGLTYIGVRPWVDFIFFRKTFKYWDAGLPVAVAVILGVVSGFPASILRTLAMTLAVLILRWRKCFTSTVQILSTSAALLLLWDPSLLTGISFVLSVGGTYFLAKVSENISSRDVIKQYFILALILPVLSAPVIGFYFGTWSYLIPICQLLMNWLWSVFLIPMGYLIPLLGFFPTGIQNRCFLFLDSLLRKLNETQTLAFEEIHRSVVLWVRPTWIETMLLVLFLIVVLDFFFKERSTQCKADF